jgi:photosystem II stability/assembly factor-like uncharacterized protein
MKPIRLTFLLLLLFGLTPFLKASASTPTTSEDTYWQYFPIIAREYTFSSTIQGPFIGRVLGVGQDPFTPSNLYAMTYGSGMFKSTNFGATWSPASVGISNLTLQSMAVDPVAPNIVYAGGYGDTSLPACGVFKSTNGGASWSQTGVMANTWGGVRYSCPVVYALAVDPLNHNRVFAGTRMHNLPSGSLGGGGVFRSLDGGATWTPVNTGLPSVDLYIYDVFIDAHRAGVVYAALHQHGLYRSDNYGNSWYPLNGTPYSGRAVSVDPYNSNTLYFGAVKKLGLYRSTNYGAGWSKTGDSNWDVAVGAISTDPYHQGRVFAGILSNNTDSYLLQSSDGGVNWSPAGSLSIWGRIAFSPDGKTDLVGVDYDGPYMSNNGGRSWFPSKQGLSGFSVTGVALSPKAPDLLYAGLYGLGVYKSNNGGYSWSPASGVLGNNNTLSVAVDPANSSVVYAGMDGSGVYRTTNGGNSWAALTSGYPVASAPLSEPNGALVPTPVSPFENRPVPELDGLKDETDGSEIAPGALAAATGLASTKALTVSQYNSSAVLAGTAGRGIYRLNGSTWAASNRTTGTVYNLIFDRATPGRAFAAMDAASGGVLVTTNDGQTWQAANTGLAGRTVYSLAQHAKNALIFLAGTDSGVYQSIDGGITWTQAGLYGLAVKTVSLMPDTTDLWFAGTESTFYYSQAGTYTWKPMGTTYDNIGIQGITKHPTAQVFYIYSRLGGVIRLDVY